jgi:hypothetical protein
MIIDDASRKAKVWPNMVIEQGIILGSNSGISARDKNSHVREMENNTPYSIKFA